MTLAFDNIRVSEQNNNQPNRYSVLIISVSKLVGLFIQKHQNFDRNKQHKLFCFDHNNDRNNLFQGNKRFCLIKTNKTRCFDGNKKESNPVESSITTNCFECFVSKQLVSTGTGSFDRLF
jgi:hypothetical protein